MTRTLSALALVLALALPASAQKIAVTGGKTDQTNVVVAARLPAGGATIPNSVTLPGGMHAPAQVARGSMAGEKDVAEYLVFVLPKLKAGETIQVTPTMLNYVKAPPQFKFAEAKDGTTDLLFDGRKVLQYFHPVRDAKDHYYTFKPFHNVYDPAKGEVMLTNTSAKTKKDGQFPHHRGLFFGFNKVTYGDKQDADIWHGTNNVFSQHDKMLSTEAGEVLGRHRSAISWHGKDGKAFANEEREVTAYAVPGGTLIDWSTVVSTKLDKVRLDGDPQHAGFHFRANMEVSKTDKETYYLRPDGKGSPGETRNWDAEGHGPEDGEPAVERVQLRGRRQAVHGAADQPPGEPEGDARQRARLRPVRGLLRVRPDARHAAEAEVPRVGAGGRDDGGAVRRDGGSVRHAPRDEGREVEEEEFYPQIAQMNADLKTEEKR